MEFVKRQRSNNIHNIRYVVVTTYY